MRDLTVLFFFLFLPLAVCFAGSAEPAPSHEIDVQGHRGCRGLLPENSIPAFRRALELGVTTLELDVQATSDGVLFAHHDAKLDSGRCVDAEGREVKSTPLRRLTADQLAGIDCGLGGAAGFPEQDRISAPIPRLEEVLLLERGASYPVRLSIEIKLQDAKGLSPREMAGLLVAEIRNHALVDRTTVQSFSPEALTAVHELEPALRRAILVRGRGAYDEVLRESGADVLSPKFTGLKESDVRRFQERGVLVIPWTVNEPSAIARLLDWGVDGIISDYPDRVLEVLSSRPALD